MRRLIVTATFIVTAGILVFILTRHRTAMKAMNLDDLPNYETFSLVEANRVVNAVEHGDIKPDKSGVADVPAQIHLTTFKQRITIFHPGNQQTLIYFPLRSYRFGSIGYLHCKQNLHGQDSQFPINGVRSIQIIDERSRDIFPFENALPIKVLVPLSKEIAPYWWYIQEPKHAI